jgi:hypothetical protein
MPNVSTYIRTKDLSKYLTIHEKGEWAEFIHNALEYKDMINGTVLSGILTEPVPKKTPKKVIGTANPVMSPAVNSPIKPKIIKTAKDVPFETFFKKGKK